MPNRLAMILPVYLAIYTLSYALAYAVRFDFAVPPEFVLVARGTLPFVLAIKFVFCILLGEWKRTYRYVTVTDLVALGLGAVGSSLTILAVDALLLPASRFPGPSSAPTWPSASSLSECCAPPTGPTSSSSGRAS